MGIDLYFIDISAPCASVRFLANSLGVELNLKSLNLAVGEHLTPEFIKKNPQHTVPTLDDNGFYLWESRAILVYLCEAYAKDDSLYPKCPKKRSVINQRLHFDMGTLYHRFGEVIYPVVFYGGKEISEDKKSRLNDALGWLDGFVSDGYVVGDSITVADYATIASIAAMEAAGIDLSAYKNIATWMANCKENIKDFKDLDDSVKFGEFVGSRLKEQGVTL